ncbi:MAG: 50S ribosomal protein L11 methyltransferase [Vicinamibacterales bacterium]
MAKQWPALIVRATTLDDPPHADDALSALLDDYAPAAIEDLAERPLPPGGLWDPTYPPIPDPPPTPLHWRVFFSDVDARAAARRAILQQLPALQLEDISIPDEDWAARSQASLTAVHAGSFIVAPPWDVPTVSDGVSDGGGKPSGLPDGKTVIIIEPSMGFGTGHHQTTRLCLRLLSEVDVRDRDVLDLGTGSGVLAMAAALRGAKSVVGIDVDTDAIQSAQHSAKLNPLPFTLQFRVADFRSQPVADAEIVLANLTGGMLTQSGVAVGSLVRPHGTLILSGFDHTEVDGVLNAFAGFVEEVRLSEDTWVALLLRKP